MLAIRYQRQGRKNSAFFRVVLTESSRPPKSGFLKILGWYNPHTKESKLEKDQILLWLDKGAKASNSVAKLLNANGIKHKNAEFVADAPKQKRKPEEEKAAKPAAESSKAAEEATQPDAEEATAPEQAAEESAPTEEAATETEPEA